MMEAEVDEALASKSWVNVTVSGRGREGEGRERCI